MYCLSSAENLRIIQANKLFTSRISIVINIFMLLFVLFKVLKPQIITKQAIITNIVQSLVKNRFQINFHPPKARFSHSMSVGSGALFTSISLPLNVKDVNLFFSLLKMFVRILLNQLIFQIFFASLMSF